MYCYLCVVKLLNPYPSNWRSTLHWWFHLGMVIVLSSMLRLANSGKHSFIILAPGHRWTLEIYFYHLLSGESTAKLMNKFCYSLSPSCIISPKLWTTLQTRRSVSFHVRFICKNAIMQERFYYYADVELSFLIFYMIFYRLKPK